MSKISKNNSGIQNGDQTGDPSDFDTYLSNKRVLKGYEAMKNGADPKEAVESMKTPNPSPEEFLEEAAKRAKKSKADSVIHIKPHRLLIKMIQLEIIGDTPLITNKWSEKSIQMMADKQSQKTAANQVSKAKEREPKIPEECFRRSLYGPFPDGTFAGKYWFPALAFKNACAQAALSMGEGVTRARILQAFHVMGEGMGGHAAVLHTGSPQMRTDPVRLKSNGSDVADLRYRGEFLDWSTVLIVRWNEAVMDASQIVEIFNVAGFAVGIGEWRPQKEGMNGQFHVKNSGD